MAIPDASSLLTGTTTEAQFKAGLAEILDFLRDTDVLTLGLQKKNSLLDVAIAQLRSDFKGLTVPVANANNWVDLLLLTESGRTQREKNSDNLNVLDFFTPQQRATYLNDPSSVDASTAIQATVYFASTLKRCAIAHGAFYTTKTIVLDGDIDFSQADFYTTAALAFDVRQTAGTAPYRLMCANIILPRLIQYTPKPSTGWTAGTVGVKMTNLYSCNVNIGRVQNFETNVLCYGTGTGFVYNEINVGWLDNGKVNLLFDADATGWCNENNFYGGRYSQLSAEGTNVAGVRHIKMNCTPNGINNNVFYKPCIEGSVPEYHIDCGGSHNQFLFCRWEANPPKVLYRTDDALATAANLGTLNLILGGYQVDNVQISIAGTNSGFRNRFTGMSIEHNNISSATGGHRYRNSSSGANPVITIFDATDRLESSNLSAACVQIAARQLTAKRNTDAYPRMKLDFQSGRMYLGGGTVDPVGFFGIAGTALSIGGGVNLVPSTDNAVNLGAPSLRWSTIYAGTATINTSDERLKQQWRSQSDAEKAAALEIKANIGLFKFNDAVDLKGDGARWHVGVKAQQVISILEAHDLNPFDYGFVCYDQWDEQAEVVEQHEAIPQVVDDFGTLVQAEKEAWTEIIQEYRAAGNRYGIRYDELAMFILASI